MRPFSRRWYHQPWLLSFRPPAPRLRGCAFRQVAQRTGADVVTVCNDYFFGDDPPPKGHVPHGRWVPLGAAPNVRGAAAVLPPSLAPLR